MKTTVKSIMGAVTVCAALAVSGTSYAADPIAGNWRTQSGETARIAACGGSYCITLKTGKYAGKRIGRMKKSGGGYTGTITDPADDKKYSGSAKVKGKGMKMRGCFLKVLCKTQNWRKL